MLMKTLSSMFIIQKVAASPDALQQPSEAIQYNTQFSTTINNTFDALTLCHATDLENTHISMSYVI